MTNPIQALIIETAIEASVDAALKCMDTLGSDRGDCGNCWLIIPQQKGRKALLAALAAAGCRVDSRGSVHILHGIKWQSRLVFEHGYRAFERVLNNAGIACHVHSYAD